MNIVDIAEEEAKRHRARAVSSIELDIGEMAGVEMDALDFAWESSVRNTVLEHAERIVHRIPGRARCLNCSLEYPIQEAFDPCPACGEVLVEHVQGKELKVKSLVLSDD
ncbi:MAG: hydrogenase maturation nickel metallochaperone HypA [Cyclobacteriaceae bacterium]|nr:hydrogenase maturation nickel metallochaperone HypA [Cyclobacteriaceae bacterium]